MIRLFRLPETRPWTTLWLSGGDQPLLVVTPIGGCPPIPPTWVVVVIPTRMQVKLGEKLSFKEDIFVTH